jgi:hypothetical protein
MGQDYVLPARLLSAHRPYSRPDPFGVAQIHQIIQYLDASRWSEQQNWTNNEDNWSSHVARSRERCGLGWAEAAPPHLTADHRRRRAADSLLYARRGPIELGD